MRLVCRDSVTVYVNAIMYYRVVDAVKVSKCNYTRVRCHVTRVQAVVNVDDYGASAQALAATTLRNVLGTRSLGEILSDRVQIASEIYEMLVEGTQGREGEFSNVDFGVHRYTELLVVHPVLLKDCLQKPLLMAV